MITLLEGPASRLYGHAARLAAQDPAVLVLTPLPPDSSTPTALPLAQPWAGFRRWVDELRQRVGEPAVTRVLEQDVAASSLILGSASEAVGRSLRPPEADALERLATNRLSHMSHNLLTQHEMFERAAVVSRDLCGLLPEAKLLIPDLARIDRESLSALRRLIRRFPDQAPQLVAGFDPQMAEEEPDENGLLWKLPPHDVWLVVLGLRTLDDTEVEVLASEGPELLPPEPAEEVSPQEGAPEAIVDRMRWSFGSFAFTATVRQGLDLLRDEARMQELSNRKKAELHSLVALAAHNRQFRSDGNLPLGHFLDRQLRAAWENEPSQEAALRSATAYRLAVVNGRRLKERHLGLEWANRAIEEARRVDKPLRAAHLEAWGRNIRAYISMGLQRSEDAEQDCRRAFELVEAQLSSASTAESPTDSPAELADSVAAAAASKDPLLREMAFTRSLLADNLGGLLILQDRTPEALQDAAAWKRRSDELAEYAPDYAHDLARFEKRAWLVLYREQGRLRAALPKALEGADAARREQDALRLLHYTVHAADLEYRLGRAEAAYEHFTEAVAVRAQIGDPAFLRDMTLFRAAAARRAGRQAVAAALLDDLLGRPTEKDEAAARDERVHLLALRGEVDALRSRPTRAQSWINDAIELALHDGVRDTMASVALAAARASRHLGEKADAAEAYARALELTSFEVPTLDDSEASPMLQLEASVGYLGSREDVDDPTRLAQCRRALLCLPEALDDAEAWWLLAPLLAQVCLLDPSQVADLDRPLQTLEQAAEQRDDCKNALKRFRLWAGRQTSEPSYSDATSS